jgi:hypothetical protein
MTRYPNGLANFFHAPFNIRHHVVIPKAQNLKACFFQYFRSLCVVFSPLSMLPAIEFYNQSGFPTYKVGVISHHWRLAAEFETQEPAVSDLIPKFPLCLCLIPPESSGSNGFFQIHTQYPLTLSLSPIGVRSRGSRPLSRGERAENQ